MTESEELLAYIERMKVQMHYAETYGDNWKRYDWRSRRSLKAGELCSTFAALTKAEAKCRRLHRGSIGYRKTRARIKALRRDLRDLCSVIKEPYSEYDPELPQYIPGKICECIHDRGVNILFKDTQPVIAIVI